MTVTFIGHSDASEKIAHLLEEIIVKLIENHNADTFYVGVNGNFDNIVSHILVKLKKVYPQIKAFSVLAYMPTNSKTFKKYELETILPEEVSMALPRFAISKRNFWMINKCHILVSYVRRTYGGAFKIREIAKAKGKIIIDI